MPKPHMKMDHSRMELNDLFKSCEVNLLKNVQFARTSSPTPWEKNINTLCRNYERRIKHKIPTYIFSFIKSSFTTPIIATQVRHQHGES